MSKLCLSIATARTGSTLFSATLKESCADAADLRELFYPGTDFAWGYEFWRVNYPNQEMSQYLEYLTEYSQQEYLFANIKLEAAWLRGDGILSVLEEQQRPVVIIYRKNLLDQVISEAIMYQRTRSGDTEIHKHYKPSQLTVTLEPKEIAQRMQRKKALYLRLRDYSLNSVWISYEELSSNLSHVIHRAAAHYDIPITFTQSGLVKQTDPVQNILTNYHQVMGYMKDHKIDHYMTNCIPGELQ